MSLIGTMREYKPIVYRQIRDICLETGLISTDLDVIFNININELCTKYLSNADFRSKYEGKEDRLVLEAYNSMLQAMNIEEKRYKKEKHHSLKLQQELQN